MTALTLLIICVAAQILIAGALGIYLFRHFRRQRRAEKPESSPVPFSSPGKK